MDGDTNYAMMADYSTGEYELLEWQDDAMDWSARLGWANDLLLPLDIATDGEQGDWYATSKGGQYRTIWKMRGVNDTIDDFYNEVDDGYELLGHRLQLVSSLPGPAQSRWSLARTAASSTSAGDQRWRPSMPPATVRISPVMCLLAAGLESTTQARAMSSGRASCRSGIVAVTAAMVPGVSRAASAMGVTVHPGSSGVARAWGSRWTTSFFTLRIRPWSAAFVAA